MGELNVERREEFNFGNTPIGKTGNINIDENIAINEKKKDTLETSQNLEKKQEGSFRIKSDEPELPPPEGNQDNAIAQMKSNPWFKPSFLNAFTSIMSELLDLQRDLHFQEAQNEQTMRSELFKQAKLGGQYAKETTLNQAREQTVQAMASFANAAVSTGQFMQTTRNLGASKNLDADNAVTAQQTKVDAAKTNYDTEKTNFKNAQTAHNASVATSPSQLPAPPAPDATAKDAAKKGWKDEQRKLDDMKQIRDRKEQAQLTHLDQQTQTLGQVFQSTINGTQGVLIASIKSETAVYEEMQKINDGFIQSINKYSETATKARDDAASNYSRFLEFMNRIIESDFKAHALSGRG